MEDTIVARKSIEDVMNEIEDFMNSCKTTALSSNKVIVPRDEFDELFGDLKVKIPAEIDRCKKIMRNKEAILMDARKTADDIIAQAQSQAAQMISETAIIQQANQQAYETVELARVQANEMLGQATAESNEIRLGSMQYTNDIMIGIRNFVEATINAERANYENLIATLEQDYTIVSANIEEVQGQIIDFTGDPNSVPKAPQIKTAANGGEVPPSPKAKQSMMQKMKNAVSGKDNINKDNLDKDNINKEENIHSDNNDTDVNKRLNAEKSSDKKHVVDIPDLIATGEDFVPNDTPLEATISAKTGKPVSEKVASNNTDDSSSEAVPNNDKDFSDQSKTVQNENSEKTKKVKKVVRKRNPVLHTPQTAQETVAKTLEVAAASTNTDKAVFKANGEPARVSSNDGNGISGNANSVKRGPRVGRAVVSDDTDDLNNQDTFIVTEYTGETEEKTPVGKSMGTIDDFSMDKKY